jgi:hypothetical protein
MTIKFPHPGQNLIWSRVICSIKFLPHFSVSWFVPVKITVYWRITICHLGTCIIIHEGI